MISSAAHPALSYRQPISARARTGVARIARRMTIPINSRDDWLEVSADAALALSHGLDIALETRVPRGKGRTPGLRRLVHALNPAAWRVVMESADDVEPFILRNSSAIESVLDVTIVVDNAS